MARIYALSADDADDCAMEFVLRVQTEAKHIADSGATDGLRPKSKPAVLRAVAAGLAESARAAVRKDLPETESSLWLRRCVINHVKDFRRRTMALDQREGVSLDDLPEGAARITNCEMTLRGWTCPWESPEAVTIDRLSFNELRGELETALARQPARSSESFVRFHLLEESASDIGTATGQSAAAVRQSAYRCRGAIQRALVRRGIDCSA